jgi:hypothetical protein
MWPPEEEPHMGIIENEQRLLIDKLAQAIEALTNISNGLDAFVAERKDERRILDERMHTITAQLNDMIDVFGSKLDGLVKGVNDHVKLSNSKFDTLIAGFKQILLLDEKLDILIARSES